MIRYVSNCTIATYPRLADSMFQDRRRQFVDRLGWDLRINKDGWEQDEYDCSDTIYIIWENIDGSHGASMRIMPTTGRTMLNDHFIELNNGAPVVSSTIWECTRLCAAPRGGLQGVPILRILMLAAHEFGMRIGLTGAVGVFDKQMIPIYRELGWEPNIIGASIPRNIVLGHWPIGELVGKGIAKKSGIPIQSVKVYFDAAYPLLRRANPAVDRI